MAGIFYYLPRPKLTAEVVRDAGLGYTLGRGLPKVDMNPGPDGGAGMLFQPLSMNTTAAIAEISNGSARWEKMPTGDAWYGYLEKNPPAPSDLARDAQLAGHECELTDGNRWLIPVARCIDGTTPLPRSIKWSGNESGWTEGDVLLKHKRFFDEACKAWDMIMGAVPDTTSIDMGDLVDLSALALSINYRIGPAEISLLGLLDTKTNWDVAKLILDFPVLEEIKKKMDLQEHESAYG